ncbi:MAG: carbohydrate ABC transporter permease [Chloroflexota bacterium]
MSASRTRGLLESVVWHALLIVVSLLVLVPIVFLVLGSFKTVQQFFAAPYGLPQSWTLSNYVRAWQEAAISTTFPNSVIVTTSSVIISTTLACLAAYGIARFSFRLRTGVRLLFVGGLVVPVQLIMLPLFVLLREIGALGTLPGLIIAYSVFGIPLGVLILVGFFATLPRDLEDAARIDGASHFRVFLDVMLPLMRPALAAVVILNGVWMWNDFFIALILSTRPDTHTLPVGIINFYGTYSTEWGLIFANVTISLLPVLLAYVALSRQFISGLTAGAVKG